MGGKWGEVALGGWTIHPAPPLAVRGYGYGLVGGKPPAPVLLFNAGEYGPAEIGAPPQPDPGVTRPGVDTADKEPVSESHPPRRGGRLFRLPPDQRLLRDVDSATST